MSCNVTLSAIARHCGSNNGGNKALYIANEADVQIVPAPDANTATISTDLTMETGKVFMKLGFDKKSCTHTEDPGDNGQVTGSIVAEFSKDDGTKRHLFDEMRGGDYVVIVEDSNGMKKIARSCECSPAFASGTAGGDKNAWTVTFTYDDGMALEYTGAIAE